VALFLKPLAQELVTVKEILETFGEASGLQVNYAKTSAVLIRGDVVDGMVVKHFSGCELGTFPCKYLGLQLTTGQLKRAHWQPVLDKVITALPAWHRGLLAMSGRLVLIKAVVTTRPVHQLLVLDALAWLLSEIDRWIRAFFWAGKEVAHGGQCLVSWQQVCKPLCFGGSGVHCLKLQGLALRVRWEWLRCTEPDKPWQGLPMLKDATATHVFDSLVSIKVGDGAKTLLWSDRWIHGVAIRDCALIVFESVGLRKRSRRTVREGLLDHAWILDVGAVLDPEGIEQCLLIINAVNMVEIDTSVQDQFSWSCSATSRYTASSTYNMLVLT
jgi:hypothetical protein